MCVCVVVFVFLFFFFILFVCLLLFVLCCCCHCCLLFFLRSAFNKVYFINTCSICTQYSVTLEAAASLFGTAVVSVTSL